MTLPRVTLPENTIHLKGLDAEVRYRPYTVGEEKILLLAYEDGARDQITLAIKQVLQGCILTEGVLVDDMPYFDFEEFFLRIRSVSVSNVSNPLIPHQEPTPDGCEHRDEVEVRYDDIQLDRDPPDRMVPIDDRLGVVMRYPTINEISAFERTPDGILRMIAGCMESVYELKGDDVFPVNSVKDAEGWIGELTKDQFKMLTEFFTSLPKLSYEVDVECGGCGVRKKFTLRGLQSFFTSA